MVFVGPQSFLTEVPTDVDLVALEADLAADGVAVLNPAHTAAEPALVQVVKDAKAMGVDNFQVIVLAHDYSPDTSLRDLATQVAKDVGTPTSIMVMSPSQAAGYSTGQLTRYQIEKGQDGHKPIGLTLGKPDVAARDFVTIAHGATFPWTGFTVALIVLVVAAAAVARVLTRRRSRRVAELRAAASRSGVGAATTATGRGPDRPA